MFIWEFNALAAVLMILSIGVVLGFWVAYTLSKGQTWPLWSYGQEFRHCPFCGFVHLDFKKKDPCRCPRCLSYHDP